MAIDRIEDPARRQATFEERRAELFREAAALGALGAEVALVVFDNAGHAYALGSPDSALDVLRRQNLIPVDSKEEDAPPVLDEQEEIKKEEEEDRSASAVIRKEQEETRAAAMKARMDALLVKLQPAMEGKRFWWEADVDKIGKEDLPEFHWALQRSREAVRRKVESAGISSLGK
jgi:hypothetical protein